MPKHILVIDDEVSIRTILEKALVRQCHRVTLAATGMEATRKFNADRPDLVISDLQLEDTDGLELISQFKQLSPATPCILFTGMCFDATVAEGPLALQGIHYLKKTQPLEQVLGEVKRLIEN